MSVKLFLVRNIPDSNLVKLRGVSASTRVDRNEDRPCKDTAYNADENEGLEKAKKQIGVDRLMIENELVRYYS